MHLSQNLLLPVLKTNVERLKMILIGERYDKASIGINVINQFLSLKIIQQNKIFVKWNIYLDIEKSDVMNDDFKVSFETLCQILFSLLTSKTKQIPMDITVSIKSLPQSYYDNTLSPIFNKHFGDDPELQKYTQPLFSKFCKESQATIAFDFYGGDFACGYLVVKNAQGIFETVDNEDEDPLNYNFSIVGSENIDCMQTA